VATELIFVGNFRFVNEAEAARLRLAHHGIQSFLSNAELINVDWFYGNATGWVKIFVPADQAIAARELLDALRDETQARQRERKAARRRRDQHAPADEGAMCLACGERLPADGTSCAACGWSYASAVDDEPGDAAAEPDRFALAAQPSPVPASPSRSSIAPSTTATPDDDAAEQAETSATNFWLLIAVAVGLLGFLMLEGIRGRVQEWLP
jgi:hypothetical protein